MGEAWGPPPPTISPPTAPTIPSRCPVSNSPLPWITGRTTTPVRGKPLQPKKINLSIHLAPAATGTGHPQEVLIGSFSAVTTLMAAMPGLDALPVAVTEQEPHAFPGYLINVNHPTTCCRSRVSTRY